jgi:iron complex transport system substrate-binding protein
MKNNRFNIFGYLAATILVIGWWALAFSPQNHQHTLTIQQQNRATPSQSATLSVITPIKRELLYKALSGDISLMAKLISEWDVDAQLLQINGHSAVKRLSVHAYLRSQVIGRQLSQKPKSSSKRNPRILPQTHAAASFVLALADVDQLVALPKGLRTQTKLFPQKLTDRIPIDIDRYNAETLYLAHPEIAFVAHYSHPSMVNALQNQGVKLVHLNSINSLSEIQNTLMKVGEVIDRSMEADLLAIFMDAAMMAIDNCLLPFQNVLQKPILFLYHHNQFAAPSLQTLTGQLLERIGIRSLLTSAQQKEWLIQLSREQLITLNPYHLIIATSDASSLSTQLYNDPSLANITAIQEGRVFFVDESVQQFPSQFVVLAYYDIAHAITTK